MQFYDPKEPEVEFDDLCIAEMDLGDPDAIERLAANAPSRDEADALRQFAGTMREYRRGEQPKPSPVRRKTLRGEEGMRC